MTHLVAIILGFVEGLTEFLPISSSGHLIIVRQLLHVQETGGLAFDAVIQLATSCALLVYFWRDVLDLITFKEKKLVYSIILGTIPAVLFGLLLQHKMETIFRSAHLVAYMLILGSVLFLFAQYRSRKVHDEIDPHTSPHGTRSEPLTIWKGIKIGFYQCLALVPGISRSGATISGGLIEGLSMSEAVRFSFLLSLPILFGAGLKELWSVRGDIFATGVQGSISVFGIDLILGSLAAFVTGLAAISFLMRYLKTHNLTVFIWYRIALAILILVFL